jgi:hypothetical protein
MSTAGKLYVSVNITLKDPEANNGFPTSAELDARNKITDQLDRQKLGHFVGAGGGLGAMDFSYVVEDEARARQLINEAIQRHLPGAQFEIDVGPADEADLEGDDDGDGEINWPRLAGCLAVLIAVIALVVWLVWWLLS